MSSSEIVQNTLPDPEPVSVEASEMLFPAVLRAFRARLGWTQGQAAEWLGISPRALEYWESGDPARVPSRVCQAGAWYLFNQALKRRRRKSSTTN